MEVKCKKCNHKWNTNSELRILICACCGSKLKKAEGIINSKEENKK